MDAENYETENDILLQYLLEDMDNIKSVAMPPYTQKELTPEKVWNSILITQKHVWQLWSWLGSILEETMRSIGKSWGLSKFLLVN